MIDVASGNMNSSGSANNQSTKAGGDLNNLCWSGGGGGANTLPPVVATGHRLSGGIWQLRTYYTPSPGNGSPPITTERAASEKPVKSATDCSIFEDLRGHAARVALDDALGSEAAAALRQAVVTTADGYKEVWQRLSFSTPYFLVSTTCPNPG